MWSALSVHLASDQFFDPTHTMRKIFAFAADMGFVLASIELCPKHLQELCPKHLREFDAALHFETVDPDRRLMNIPFKISEDQTRTTFSLVPGKFTM